MPVPAADFVILILDYLSEFQNFGCRLLLSKKDKKTISLFLFNDFIVVLFGFLDPNPLLGLIGIKASSFMMISITYVPLITDSAMACPVLSHQPCIQQTLTDKTDKIIMKSKNFVQPIENDRTVRKLVSYMGEKLVLHTEKLHSVRGSE